MNKGIKFLSVLCLVVMMAFAVVPNSFADLSALSASFNADDAAEVNRISHGTDRTFLGTRLRGPLQRDTADVTTDGAMNLSASNTAFFFTTTAVQGTNDPSFENGYVGQIVTFVLETDGGQNVDITPLTKTGFSSVTLQDANDSCSFKYANDTDGWYLLSNNGCTIN